MKLNHPVPVPEIESASTVALQVLLNVKEQQSIDAVLDRADRIGDSSGQMLTDRSGRVVCGLSSNGPHS